MINGSSTEFPKELFGAKVFEIGDEVRPKVKDIVPGEAVAFLHNDHLGPKEGGLYGHS